MIDNKTLNIIIPCKNEGYNIIKTLDSIKKQLLVENINVIIADNSDDDFTFDLIIENVDNYSSIFNIKIIKGGFPSQARYNGAKICESEYILFMDADVELLSEYTLIEAISEMKYNNLNLVSAKFKTDRGYNYIYRFFDFFQFISVILNTVFAVGGFQLWKRKAYLKTGGYLPELMFAEDYWVSSKVDPSKFDILNAFVYTSARRFRNKGIYYMMKMMILSYFNRNNIEFFKKHHNYWM